LDDLRVELAGQVNSRAPKEAILHEPAVELKNKVQSVEEIEVGVETGLAPQIEMVSECIRKQIDEMPVL
jgi:hypothetical protein